MTHFIRSERRLPVDVGIPSRFEQAVALAQRNLECLGKHEQGVPAWLSAPGFDEAHMAGRESRLHRQIELAHAARGPPIPQQLSDGAAELSIGRGSADVHAPCYAQVVARPITSDVVAALLPRARC